MKMCYITNVRLPTMRAHGAPIMQMASAFVTAGVDVELVIPDRKSTVDADPFEYYGCREQFAITRIGGSDLDPKYKVVFWFHMVWFLLRAWWYIRMSIKSTDVIYTRDAIIGWFFSKLGYTVFYEAHTLDDVNWLTKDVYHGAKGAVAISPLLRDDAVECFLADPELFCIAPSGIELASFQNPESKAAARQRLRLPEDKTIVMYIGSLESWKGVSTLLEASDGLSDQYQVAIIGGNEEQTTTLGKEYPNVIFLGFRSEAELADNQQAADVLVVPNTALSEKGSRYTSPLKVLAHMTSGVPIVASDLLSLRNLLSDETATFFIPDDPQSLADTIVQTAENKAAAISKAATAREQVQKYDWQIRAQNILKFIKEKLPEA